MRKLLVCVLAAATAAAVIGCGDTGAGKTETEKEFQKLYKQFSARFYEKMTTQAEALQPIQVTAEAARIWDEVFSPHRALVAKRVEEILKELDTCPPIQEDLYNEVASGARVDPPPDQPQGIVLKQFLWSPIGSAQMGLNNWLARLLQQQSFAMRSVMAANAPMFWEAIDRNVDRPKLCLRQGPLVFTVDLSRKDDYYQVERIRWLRPKSMGPLQPPPPPPTETPATGTPPAGTLPPALPPTPGGPTAPTLPPLPGGPAAPGPAAPGPTTPAPALPAVPPATPSAPAPTTPPAATPAAPSPATTPEKPAPKG